MHEERTRRILLSPEFAALRRRRTRLTWGLAGLMIGLYLAYGLAAVYLPDWLARPLGSDSAVPVGLLLAYSIILVAILLAGYYVHRTNADFEPRSERIRREHGPPESVS